MEEAPSEKQIAYAQGIARYFNLKLPDDISTSRTTCKKFLDEHAKNYISAKSNKSSTQDTSEINSNTVRTNSKNKDDPYHNIFSYWIDVLIRSSFQSLGSLPSQLENCSSFAWDKIEYFLNNDRCKNLTNIYDKETVRHLVLRISATKNSKENNYAVIASFPLKIVPVDIEKTDKSNPLALPYQWQRCQYELPLFNPKLMGEYAEIEGLNLYNVEVLQDLLEDAVENNHLFPANANLKHCLELFDKCFDALTGKEGGLEGYVRCFEKNKINFSKLKYKKLDFVLVDGGAAGGATRQVKSCYEEIINNERMSNRNNLKLLRRLMEGFWDKETSGSSEFTDDAVINGWVKADNYLGHMDNKSAEDKRQCYSLDNSQRMALTLLKEVSEGGLLAVNGPPGTGKTSLLRAVIADIWVERLLADINLPDCPIILASAATNQAVTNMISSFDQVPGIVLFDAEGERQNDVPISLESRWIPGLKSYGWYVPASLNSKEESIQVNYQILQKSKGFKEDAFWEFHCASEAFGKLPFAMIEKCFIEAGREYFESAELSLNKIIEKLRNAVKKRVAEITQLGEVLDEWMKSLTKLQALPWNDQYEKLYNTLSLSCLGWEGETGEKQSLKKCLNSIEKNIKNLSKIYESLEKSQEDTLWSRLKSFLTSFVSPENEKTQYEKNLRETLVEYGVSLSETESPSLIDWNICILNRIKVLQEERIHPQLEYQKKQAEYESYQRQLKPLKVDRQRYLDARCETEKAQYMLIAGLEKLFGNNSQSLVNKIKKQALSFEAKDFSFSSIIVELQELLDKNLRPTLFHLAARYWEGRYILHKKRHRQLLKTQIIDIPTEEHFRELAMLAPVFVVTTHSAPKLMKRINREKEITGSLYLFDFADLLIVDEAGQATPEIAACVFAFAKRAIVVGDVKQLAPVWNIEWATDRLMIQKYQLIQLLQKKTLPSASAETALREEYGLLASSGCIMKMAQNATAFYDRDFVTPGVMLTRHYRCRAPIIEICNKMVYEGALKVVAQATEPRSEWRNPLGFLVTSSESTKQESGSRCNYKEAELIAKWIHDQRNSIIQHYNIRQKDKILDLPDILAVVTPYKGQVSVLKKAIAKALNEDPLDKNALVNQIVIGTVHSLQGAEKNIVIFSMVDTVDPDSEHFYDKDTSLINVAISRAKEVFVVAMDQKAVNYAKKITQSKLKKPGDYIWYYIVSSGKRLNPCRLIIIESPNKTQHIETALMQGMELEVIATNGHLTQLDADLSWDPLYAQEPQWQNLTEKELQLYNRVSTLWNDMEAIYLATDPDAEGECIAWHFLSRIKQHLPSQYKQKKLPIIKRMRFHSLVKEEICHAYENAVDGLDAGLVKSAMVRTFLDQIIARHYPHKLNIGPANKFCAGVGRVQLAILDIVNQFANRQKQYAIEVQIPLQGQMTTMMFYLADDNQKLLFNDEKSARDKIQELEQIFVKGDMVRSLWKSQVKQLPEYPAINTATFLALASRIHHLTPKRTMEVLQALYEGQTQVSEVMREEE